MVGFLKPCGSRHASRGSDRAPEVEQDRHESVKCRRCHSVIYVVERSAQKLRTELKESVMLSFSSEKLEYNMKR